MLTVRRLELDSRVDRLMEVNEVEELLKSVEFS